MKLLDYLKDKKYIIFIYVLCSLLTGTIIWLSESAPAAQSYGFYSICLSLFIFSLYLLIEFLIKKNHYDKIKKNSLYNDLDWVNSMPKPLSREEKIYYDLLLKLYGESNEMMTKYNNSFEENLEFVTMWVHEAKTPITAIKLIIQNSLDNPTEKDLYSIEDEVDKIEEFVQMTLCYVRSMDFEKDFLLQGVNLGSIVRNCISKEYSVISNKHIVLDTSDIDIKIDTDEKWLSFIVKQILDNAIKYSVEHGTVRVYLVQEEKKISLCIEDSGIGIKPEDLNRIFDKNYTGYNGRNAKNSTGIGLYLSKIFCEKLGYTLLVSSEYGRGTKFSIVMPKRNDYYISIINNQSSLIN